MNFVRVFFLIECIHRAFIYSWKVLEKCPTEDNAGLPLILICDVNYCFVFNWKLEGLEREDWCSMFRRYEFSYSKSATILVSEYFKDVHKFLMF